jgi:hypothetical protein
MNTSTNFSRVIALVLIASIFSTPLAVFAQAAETPPVVSAPATDTSATVEAPAVETSPVTPDNAAPTDTTPPAASPVSDITAPTDEVKAAPTDEPTPTDVPKLTDAPLPKSLLDSSESPYEHQRQPVNTKLQINTDEPTGALTLSYPIKTPPGRNGIEPSLSLKYNSQSQENVNVAGFGWSADIPYIERINRKGAETLFSDFYFRSSWDDELASTSATSTEYGAKVENGSFRKYEYKNQQYWKVTDKNGTGIRLRRDIP